MIRSRKCTLSLCIALAIVRSNVSLCMACDQKESAEVRKPFDESRIAQLPKDIRHKILKDFMPSVTIFPRLWANKLYVFHTWNFLAWNDSVVIDPTGKLIAAVNENGSARIWSLEEGRLLYTLNTAQVITAIFNHDGTRVATITNANNAKVSIWNTSDGSLLQVLSENTIQKLVCAMFTDDGEHLMGVGDAGMGVVWNINAANVVDKFAAHREGSMRFSKDKTRLTLVSGYKDKPNGDVCGLMGLLNSTLQKHYCIQAIFISDKNHLITVSKDKTIRIWKSLFDHRIFLQQGPAKITLPPPIATHLPNPPAAKNEPKNTPDLQVKAAPISSIIPDQAQSPKTSKEKPIGITQQTVSPIKKGLLIAAGAAVAVGAGALLYKYWNKKT